MAHELGKREATFCNVGYKKVKCLWIAAKIFDVHFDRGFLRFFGGISQILFDRHLYAVDLADRPPPDINFLKPASSFRVVELVDRKDFLSFGLVDG